METMITYSDGTITHRFTERCEAEQVVKYLNGLSGKVLFSIVETM